MDLAQAIKIVADDQRQNDFAALWTDNEAVAYARHVLLPHDAEPGVGAVRVDYDLANPIDVAVDMVLRATDAEMDATVGCVRHECANKESAREFGSGDFFLCGTCDLEEEADCEHEATSKHLADGHQGVWVPNDKWERTNKK